MTEIRYLEEWEKRGTIPLWREAFPEDSDGFVEYYYKEKTRDNRILAAVEEQGDGKGRIVSMVHRNPYRLWVQGHVVDSDYVVAVATAEDRRHRGLMRGLLTRMLEDMYREQMPFCYLMPADPRIYEPFDFAFVYDQEYWGLTREAKGRLSERRVSVGDHGAVKTASRWMEGWLRGRFQVSAVRDRAYVERLLLELESEEGWLELLYDRQQGREASEGTGEGRLEEGEEPVGVRCWWGTGKTEERFLLCEDRYRERRKESSPAIMARITHLERCLGLLHLREDSPVQEWKMILRVDDPLCLWNRGTFLWKLDRWGSVLARWDEGEPDGLVAAEIRVDQLAQWIFGYGELTELLPKLSSGECNWWDWIQVWQGVFLDEVV